MAAENKCLSRRLQDRLRRSVRDHQRIQARKDTKMAADRRTDLVINLCVAEWDAHRRYRWSGMRSMPVGVKQCSFSTPWQISADTASLPIDWYPWGASQRYWKREASNVCFHLGRQSNQPYVTGRVHELYGPVNKMWSFNFDKAMISYLACLKEFADFAHLEVRRR